MLCSKEKLTELIEPFMSEDMEFLWSFTFILCLAKGLTYAEDEVKYANQCEVCKIVSQELEIRLQETGKSHDVIETGYSIESKKAKKKYHGS